MDAAKRNLEEFHPRMQKNRPSSRTQGKRKDINSVDFSELSADAQARIKQQVLATIPTSASQTTAKTSASHRVFMLEATVLSATTAGKESLPVTIQQTFL